MDSVTAVPQLLAAAPDYIMLDYLSEGAMSILARMLQQYPGSGFPPDVATVHIGPHLREIKAKGVKIVANGGGLNP
jgi:regulator of sigma D